MPTKNILIVLILFFIILLPFVTKGSDSQGPASVRILPDINYTTDAEPASKIANQSVSHLLDIYIPTKTKTPPPLIVYIHGGAWLQGSKDEAREWLGVFLCRKGFAVASINYRLSQEAIFPAQIEDCKAAIRFLRAHAGDYNIDPKHIGVWGVSAGGHLASLLGTSCGAKNLEGNLGNLNVDSCIQAVCDWCGPSDLISVAGQAGTHTQLDYESTEGPVAKLLGGRQQDKHDLAVAASPVTYVDKTKTEPPFLIVHGDSDDMVPFAQSQELHDKLNKAGVPNKLITVVGGGHGFTNEEQLNHMVEFFKETLIEGNRKMTVNQ